LAQNKGGVASSNGGKSRWIPTGAAGVGAPTARGGARTVGGAGGATVGGDCASAGSEKRVALSTALNKNGFT
jgi:hypothetical protein